VLQNHLGLGDPHQISGAPDPKVRIRRLFDFSEQHRLDGRIVLSVSRRDHSRLVTRTRGGVLCPGGVLRRRPGILFGATCLFARFTVLPEGYPRPNQG
jgi:hypothetical protein